MASPGQIYHSSGKPPVLYYLGKEYIGGTVAYDRSVTIAAPGFLNYGNPNLNQICDLSGTIDLE